MGLLDSLQGVLIVVAGRGNQVPGVMQNLLLQGAVPVTMFASLLFLRNRGCSKCKETREFLSKQGIKFTENKSVTERVACDGESGCACYVVSSTGEQRSVWNRCACKL